MEEALENNQGPIFSQQFLAANQRAEAKKALKDIQDRHAEILKLEESLRVSIPSLSSLSITTHHCLLIIL